MRTSSKVEIERMDVEGGHQPLLQHANEAFHMRFTMRISSVVTAIILQMICAAMSSWAQAPEGTSGAGAQRQAVRTVVTDFGKRLRMVAVLAPKDIVGKAMDEAYSRFVAPDLLEAWKNDPERAPGKRTSSPSPERIDITSITAKGRDTYTVRGKVILLTAQERREGGVFQANPVTITVAQQGQKWVITAYAEKEVHP